MNTFWGIFGVIVLACVIWCFFAADDDDEFRETKEIDEIEGNW
jgi:hypothetical protein